MRTLTACVNCTSCSSVSSDDVFFSASREHSHFGYSNDVQKKPRNLVEHWDHTFLSQSFKVSCLINRSTSGGLSEFNASNNCCFVRCNCSGSNEVVPEGQRLTTVTLPYLFSQLESVQTLLVSSLPYPLFRALQCEPCRQLAQRLSMLLQLRGHAHVTATRLRALFPHEA